MERMKDDQEEIYYVSGENVTKCAHLPQTEFVVSKGYEVLYFTDEIDEFAIQMLREYEGKTFKSINQGDLDLVDEETKKSIEAKKESHKDLIEALKETLKDEVDDVTLSTRLVNHPVCLVSEEGVSFEMEKVLNAIPDQGERVKAKRILEINPDHPLLEALERVHQEKPNELGDFATILYDQACLIEGLPIKDPVTFSKRVADLMVASTK